MKKGLVLLLALACVCGLMAGPASAAEDTYKVAVFEPLSGPFKYLGDLYISVLRFHADQYNAAGGLLGKKIEIIPYDSQLKPDVASKLATQAILEKKVNVIGTGSGSHVAKALSQLGKRYKVLAMSYGAEAASLTGQGCHPFFFRVCLSTAQHSATLAAYLAGRKDVKKVGIICQDYNFGREAAADFKKALKAMRPDIKIAVEVYHPMMNKDFAPYITKLNAADVPWIFTSNWGPDLGGLLKQGQNLGLKGRLLTYYVEDPFLLRDSQQGAVGAVTAEVGSTVNPYPVTQAVNKAWHESYKKYVTSDDPIYQWPHPAMWKTFHLRLLFEAVKKAGTFDTVKVIKALEGLEMDGINGKAFIRAEDHQIQLPVPVVEITSKEQNKYDQTYPGGKVLEVIPREKTTVPLADTGCQRPAR